MRKKLKSFRIHKINIKYFFLGNRKARLAESFKAFLNVAQLIKSLLLFMKSIFIKHKVPTATEGQMRKLSKEYLVDWKEPQTC